MTKPRLSRDAMARIHAEAMVLNTNMLLDHIERSAREIGREAKAALKARKALKASSRCRP